MWQSKHSQKLQKVINVLLKDITIKGIIFKALNEVLVREIQYSADSLVRKGNIIKTLIQMKQDNLTSFEEFVTTYNSFHFGKKLMNSTVKVLLPLRNIGFTKSFRINGQEFKIVTKEEVYKYIEKDKVQEYLKDIKKRGVKINMTNKILLILDYGENVYEAWRNISHNFSVLQGIYDWAYQSGKWTVSSRFETKTHFLHPSWILIQKGNGEFQYGMFNTGELVVKMHSITGKAVLNKLLRLVNQKAEEGSTKSLIYDCFRLYAQAMEARHKNNFFLGLWQLIENACLGENYNGKTQIIIKRISLINQETTIFGIDLNSIYENLANKRNKIVHTGIDLSDEIDINILLMLAENCIQWLIMHEKKLKTKSHIEEYFRLRTRNPKERLAILETIDYLNKGDKRNK